MDKQERDFFGFMLGLGLTMAGIIGLVWLFTNAF